MKEYSQKDGTKYQIKGYPGLDIMASEIIKYFPSNIDIYIEPFAGLARTARFVNCNNMILNDLSDYSISYLKDKFPNAIITQNDYKDVIDKYIDNENVFMLIDPPRRKNIYTNNPLPVCTNTPIEYYSYILEKLVNAKCKWILCIDKDEHEIGKRVSRSGFRNIVLEHPTRTLYGRKVGVRLATNIDEAFNLLDNK